MIHETIFFTGRVQGVGFRFTTRRLAMGFEVVGFVCNLDDGRVELQVQGAQSEIDGFVRLIEEEMTGHIRKVDRARQPITERFSGFDIR